MNRTNIFKDELRVLHVAPEPILQKKLKSLRNLDYISADLKSSSAMIKMDITDALFKENVFDIILCYHVMEHIMDDKQAIREIYRMLKPGGWAIIQSPIDMNQEHTIECSERLSPEELRRVFGHRDHVRRYGRDYIERLESVGFKVEIVNLIQEMDNETIRKYALDENERIFRCIKEERIDEAP